MKENSRKYEKNFNYKLMLTVDSVHPLEGITDTDFIKPIQNIFKYCSLHSTREDLTYKVECERDIPEMKSGVHSPEFYQTQKETNELIKHIVEIWKSQFSKESTDKLFQHSDGRTVLIPDDVLSFLDSRYEAKK